MWILSFCIEISSYHTYLLGTHYVDHASLKLTEISVSASWVQELKACATTPSLQVNIYLLENKLVWYYGPNILKMVVSDSVIFYFTWIYWHPPNTLNIIYWAFTKIPGRAFGAFRDRNASCVLFVKWDIKCLLPVEQWTCIWKLIV